jgi:hypothetical protein
VRNHAHAVLACAFFTTITVRFRILYVFILLDVGTRRIVHWNVTEHPAADWTIQQCWTGIKGRLHTASRVIATPILNGLHPEYHLVRDAA